MDPTESPLRERPALPPPAPEEGRFSPTGEEIASPGLAPHLQSFVAERLAGPRPRPRAGSPTIAVRELRECLLGAEPGERHLGSDPALQAYARNVCSVLALVDLQAAEVRANPALRSTLIEHIEREYRELTELGIKPSAIVRRGHLYSAAEVRHLVERAAELFRGAPGERSRERSMIELVMRGVYPDVEALYAASREVEAEAATRFGGDPDTAGVARMAAGLVIRRERRSVEECHTIYTSALREGEEIARGMPQFGSIVRGMASVVLAGRHESMAEAAVVWQRTAAAVEAEFKDSPFESLVRTTTGLVMRGTYRSAGAAREALERIHGEMDRATAGCAELAPIARSLTLMVYAQLYPSVSAALERYEHALREAEELFSTDAAGRSLARTAAYLVTQKRYPDAAAIHERSRALEGEAARLLGDGPAEVREVARTLVLSVLKGEQASLPEAVGRYEEVLAACEERFTGPFAGAARTAATRVLRGQIRDVDAAMSRYVEIQRGVEDEIARHPILEPARGLFIHLVFGGAFSSVAEARERYLAAHGECAELFSTHEDSLPVIRTAALLVFRGVYESGAAAHRAYRTALAAARAEHGDRRGGSGEDLPGVRARAVELFSSRQSRTEVS